MDSLNSFSEIADKYGFFTNKSYHYCPFIRFYVICRWASHLVFVAYPRYNQNKRSRRQCTLKPPVLTGQNSSGKSVLNIPVKIRSATSIASRHAAAKPIGNSATLKIALAWITKGFPFRSSYYFITHIAPRQAICQAGEHFYPSEYRKSKKYAPAGSSMSFTGHRSLPKANGMLLECGNYFTGTS